jgi:hypothetical protein
MFWGCFSGLGKGPGIFWEKGWGKISAESYRAHTVPAIHGWVQLCKAELGEDLILVQDGAPGHAATETKEDLRERGIIVMDWPAIFSPDLNPIESCWNWMKYWIEDRYGLEEKPSYDKLRQYVRGLGGTARRLLEGAVGFDARAVQSSNCSQRDAYKILISSLVYLLM